MLCESDWQLASGKCPCTLDVNVMEQREATLMMKLAYCAECFRCSWARRGGVWGGRQWQRRRKRRTRSRWTTSAASSSIGLASFPLAEQWAPAANCSPSPSSTFFKCWLPAVIMGSQASFFLRFLIMFYHNSRGVIVVTRWECAMGVASGFVPWLLAR